MTDRDLVANLLAGEQAARVLSQDFQPRIEARLLASCDPTDGRSRLRASEIASEVISDCVRKDPLLVTRWDGRAPLLAFLLAVAENRLKNWWGSASVRRTVAVEPQTMAALAGQPAPDTAPATEHPPPAALVDAVRSTLAEQASQHPAALAFFRLRAFHGVEQRRLATIWGLHESTVSRQIKAVADQLQARAHEVMRQTDPEASRESTLALLCGQPSLFAAPSSQPLADELAGRLQRLAAGSSADPHDRNLAAAILAVNDRACAAFAHDLHSVDRAAPPPAPGPAAAAAHATLAAARAARAESLDARSWQELAGQPIDTLLTAIQCQLQADGAALWLLDPGRASLTIAACPAFPSIVGRSQPLAAGLVCFSFTTGQVLTIDRAAAHPSFAPGMDRHLNSATQHLIAVPLHIASACRGVVSAVRFDPDSPAFSPADTSAAIHLAAAVGFQIEAALDQPQTLATNQ